MGSKKFDIFLNLGRKETYQTFRYAKHPYSNLKRLYKRTKKISSDEYIEN